MDDAGTQGEEKPPRALRGGNWDEYDEADCSVEHARSSPRCRRPLSSDRRHSRGDRRQPANARASGGRKLLLDQGIGRGRLATTRGLGEEPLCIARGGGSTTSRKMRAPSARDRATSPPPLRGSASWTSARSARAQARTQRRKLPDVAELRGKRKVVDDYYRDRFRGGAGEGSRLDTPLANVLLCPRESGTSWPWRSALRACR